MIITAIPIPYLNYLTTTISTNLVWVVTAIFKTNAVYSPTITTPSVLVPEIIYYPIQDIYFTKSALNLINYHQYFNQTCATKYLNLAFLY